MSLHYEKNLDEVVDANEVTRIDQERQNNNIVHQTDIHLIGEV